MIYFVLCFFFIIKCRETNGRTFEFRVRDDTKRVEFLSALREALNKALAQGNDTVVNVKELGVRADQVNGFDHDDVLSNSEQTTSTAAFVQIEGDINSTKRRLRRVHSNHDTGEDEYLDVSSFEGSGGDEGGGGVSREQRFYQAAKLYVKHMDAVDAAWSSVCSQLTERSPVTPTGKGAARRRSSQHKNVLLSIDSIPLRTRRQTEVHSPLRILLQCDPEEDFVSTMDDLYACAQLAKPALDTLLQSIADDLNGSSGETKVHLESRLLTPFDASDCLQRSCVHTYSTSPSTTLAVPSDASYLPPEVVPESCLHHIVSATLRCRTGQDVVHVVEALLQRDELDVVFLDNRFVHPLGQPPVTDACTLAMQAVSYNGSYHRDLRLLVSVPYDSEESTAGFQCEVLVTLEALCDTSTAVTENSSQFGVLPAGSLEQQLAPFFTRFRSWCSHGSSVLEEEDEAEESRQRMSVLYSCEICRRVDLLREVTALSPEDFANEIEVFLDDVASEEYEENPLHCPGGHFLQLLQQTVLRKDLVSMRSVSSLFFDLELFTGCVLLQREIVEVCRLANSGDGGEEACYDETLSFELETLANLLMREDAEEGIYESIQLLEESIHLRESYVEVRKAEAAHGVEGTTRGLCENVSSLVNAMMVLASLYEEHGVPSQAITVLLGAKEISASHARNEKSLALVWHSLGLLQEQQGSLGEAAESLEEAVQLQQKHFGLGHPLCAGTLLDLGAVYLQQQRVEDALRVSRAGMNARAESVGGLLMSSPALADAMMALVPVLNATGSFVESKAYVEKALQIRREFCGTEHVSMAECWVEYGVVCRHRKEYSWARTYLEYGLKVPSVLMWCGILPIMLGFARYAVVL